VSPIYDIQKRFRELGRIRTGEQVERNGKKVASPLSCFRLTSASERILRDAAAVYGGEVRSWDGPRNEGHFELYTASSELDVLLPVVYSDRDGSPTLNVSQYYEHYTTAGCQRRCDGVTELLTGGDCQCDPGERECKPTTRMGVMLPRVPEIGIWLLTSHGYNAAAELPTTVAALLAAARGKPFVPAILRLAQREEKHADEKFPRRYVVPELAAPGVRLEQLVDIATGEPLAINPPGPERIPRPELPAAADLPADPAFGKNGEPPMGSPPPLPGGVEELRRELLDLAFELGIRDDTVKLIERNAKQHEGDADKHTAWLKRQIAQAHKKLEERDAAAEIEPFVEPEQEPMFQAPAGATGHVDLG
jgi:hypothetical protein